MPNDGSGPTRLIVVGSDTIVDLDGEILEKPGDVEEAKAMLRRLSGREHLVHSGVGIFSLPVGTGSTAPSLAASAAEPTVAFAETTQVRFGCLSEAEIAAYVATGEPMDKAGSYGIQGYGGQLVEGVNGCYFNVMGFPMRRFSTELSKLLLEL